MQQVNLYQPILRKQERVFSLKTLLHGNLLIVSVLALLYLNTLYQTSRLESQHTQVQQELQERSDRLAQLKKQYPPKTKDPSLADIIKKKQALLDHRQRLIRELRHQNTGAGGNPGFSEQLNGLSRQDIEAIWFERVSVRDGKALTLSGKATAAEEVPRLIQRLATEPSFSGTEFTNVLISRDESGKPLVAFELHTDSDREDNER